MAAPKRDVAQRTTRSAVQSAGPASIIALLAVFNVIHWTVEQTAAVMAVAVPAVSFVQNLVEQYLGRRWLR